MLPFDQMFDFNRDGLLDSIEQGTQFAFLDKMEREDREDWEDREDDEDEGEDWF